MTHHQPTRDLVTPARQNRLTALRALTPQYQRRPIPHTPAQTEPLHINNINTRKPNTRTLYPLTAFKRTAFDASAPVSRPLINDVDSSNKSGGLRGRSVREGGRVGMRMVSGARAGFLPLGDLSHHAATVGSVGGTSCDYPTVRYPTLYYQRRGNTSNENPFLFFSHCPLTFSFRADSASGHAASRDL